MPLPTWDVFIGLAFVLGISYGFILRRDKTITSLCATYIGLVIANNFSESIYNFFNGNTMLANQLWIRSSASEHAIAITVFLISIFFISGAIISSNNRSGDISPFEVITYSGLNIALILSSILMFLPEENRLVFTEGSRFAQILTSYHTALIVFPPLALIVLNFRRKN